MDVIDFQYIAPKLERFKYDWGQKLKLNFGFFDGGPRVQTRWWRNNRSEFSVRDLDATTGAAGPPQRLEVG